MRRRDFLIAASSAVVGAGMLGSTSAQTTPSTRSTLDRKTRKKRRILCNDDGHIMGSEPPLTVDHFRQMVQGYKGTAVDALFWCGVDREICTYDTRVGEVAGRRFHSFKNAGDWRIHQNTQALIESGKCPLGTLAEVCRQQGLDLFASVRMNSHYKIDPDSPSESKFRLDHPEYLIGCPPGYAEGSKEYAVRMGVNYARPEVRRHMAAIVVELFERFDVDGVEMDFMRHPVFFKFHEAFENRHHMTNMLRHIRRRRDEVSRARNRSIELAVRVPSSIASALRVGLDVRTWIREGLADIVIGGEGFTPFDMPFDEWVEAAKGSDCQMYGCIEGARSREPEVIRAQAMKYLKAGGDGLYLFNLYSRVAGWKEAPLFAEVTEMNRLTSLDKRYQIDRRNYSPGTSTHLSAVFDTALAPVQLPIQLTEDPDGRGALVTLAVADDLQSAQSRGTLKKTQLRLEFDENHTPGDQVEVRLNGQLLGGGEGTPLRAGALEYDVQSPPLRHGVNSIEVRLRRRGVSLSSPLILQKVEIVVRFK